MLVSAIQWSESAICCLVAKLWLTVLQPHGPYSPPGSTVHGIFQARILEWVAISFSRGSSWARDWNCISYTVRQVLCHYAIHIHISPPSWTSLLPPHPTSLGHHGASRWELPVLDSSFPLAICFSYGSIYMPMLLFQLIPPSPSLTEGRHVFQTSTVGLMSDWIRGIWWVLLLYAWTAPTSHSL